MACFKKYLPLAILITCAAGSIAIAQVQESGTKCEKHEDYGNYLVTQGFKGVPLDGYTAEQLVEFKKKLSETASDQLEGFVNPDDYHEVRKNFVGSYFFGIHGYVDYKDPNNTQDRPNAGCLMPISAPAMKL